MKILLDIKPHFFKLITSFLFLTLFFNCTKKEIVERGDEYKEETEQLQNSTIQINSAGLDFIEFEWTPVISSSFKKIEYDLYLNNRLMVSGVTSHKYTFIHLEEGTDYEIKVVAKSQTDKKIQIITNTKTLPQETVTSDTFYKEFQIFENTSLTGFSPVSKLKDEGHIIIRLLQHPSRYAYESFKFIAFRLDRLGNVLWYRLLSTNNYPVDFSSAALAVNETLNQAVIVSGKVLWKININNGQHVEIKDLVSVFDEHENISSVKYTSSTTELIIGTSNYKLLKVDFQSLGLLWKRDTREFNGVIKSIVTDSKGNMYYIFANESNTITVHKADPEGKFIKEFKFDGSLNGEYEHFGYGMNFMLIDKEDNLYLFGKNYYSYSLRYFKFSTEGQLHLKNESYSEFQPTSGFFDKNGNIILYGIIQGFKINFTSYINTYDKNMNRINLLTYDQLPMYAISALTQNSNGSFNVFLHYATTYTYENNNFVYIRTRENGTL